MENASKALLMAGGILIALMVIGALLLMFNQIGDYEKAQTNDKKVSQFVDFNKEYVKYTYDDIKGYDLISLINKAIDFNEKEIPVSNSVDYDKKITIKVNNINNKNNNKNTFIGKYGVSGEASLFKEETYEITDSKNALSTAISKFSELEKTYTLGVMSKLSANYDLIKNREKTIEEIVGRKITYNNKEISLEEIEQYREYSEFKNSTFRSDADPIYDGEQVVILSFKFVK